MRRKILKLSSFLLLAVSLATILSATPAFAYETLSHKIKSTITYTPYSGFTDLSIEHMGEAVEKWNDAAGATLLQMSSSTHSSTSGYPLKDGKNYVYRMDVGPGYLGECHYWWNSLTGELTQSDININVYYSFANSAMKGCYDLYSVFLHETGHAMGLNDLYGENDKKAVMYGIMYTNTTKRDLEQDDKDGIAAIYG